MRSKASLSLMELLVMILVFALASAFCMQAFGRAQAISLETMRRDEAVVLAQNGAELLKAGIGAEEIEKRLCKAPYTVRIQEATQEIPGLKQAEITVFYDDTALFSLMVGCQEVGG